MATNNSINRTCDNIQITTNTIASTNTNGNIITTPNGTGNIKTNNNSVDTMVMNSSGYRTMAKLCSFFAYNTVSNSNVTGDGTDYTIIFDTVVFDQSSNYNSGTGTFTAPITGNYRFSSQVLVTGGSAGTVDIIRLVTTGRSFNGQSLPITAQGTGGNLTLILTTITPMTANDTALVHVIGSGGTLSQSVPSTTIYTFFSGELIC